MSPLLKLALLCQFALSLGYSLWTPAFEGPDENDHAYYASLLAHKRSLPTVLRSEHSAWDHASLGHHPPLYYTLLAGTQHALGAADTVPSWRDRLRPGVFHWQHGHDEVAPVSREIMLLQLLRSWSMMFGLISVWLTHRLARLVFPRHPAVADTAALLLACLPQWSFTHGVMDNGNLATTLSSAALVVLASGVAANRLTVGRGAALGLLAGLALITKLTSLFVLVLLAMAYTLVWLRAPARRRATLTSGAVAALSVAALSGWFFWRNLQLYGDLLASEAHRAAYAVNRVPPEQVWDYLTGRFAPELYTSFIGNFGWVSLAVPAWVVTASLTMAAVSALGWLLTVQRLTPRLAPLALTVAAAALVFAQVVKFNTDFFQPQGRYLFPAAGACFVLLAAGLVAFTARFMPALTRPLPRRLLIAAPPTAALAVLLLHFAPAFRVDTAGVSPHRASMISGLATPPPADRATITLLEPANGSRLHDAPTFRWQPVEMVGARYTVHVFTAAGRVLFGTYETGDIAFQTGEFTVPEPFWAMLPTGEPLLWKVRRLPDRSKGEGVDDVPESPPWQFERRTAPD